MLLEIKDLSKEFQLKDRKVGVLKQINFTADAGDLVAIVGSSGSGKSTLLGICAGLDNPSSGSVMLCGKPLSDLNEDERAALRNKHIGFVFQSFQLLPTLTAYENVMLPLELRGLKAGDSDKAKSLLSDVGLADRLDHYPIQLSGGEQQRVALARAFINEPDILFADEPTGNLDADSSAVVVDYMMQLNKSAKTTLILVTHDLELADQCERIIRLKGGEILSDSKQTGGK